MTTRVPTERVKEILDLALERPTQEREAFVAGMCGEDATLRVEVVSLLRSLQSVDTILEPRSLPAERPAEPLTGLRFGPYQVGDQIGEGGMGVVYRARDTRLGRTVAVKALPAHLAADPHRRARFEHEARVLGALNHANIATIHGVEDSARGPVLVLEYVAGESLSERLRRGPLPLDEALPIAIQILRGLEAAHSAGIVHRDLKPANIRVTPEGATKVLDFGIAKAEAGPLLAGSPGTPDGSPVIVTAPYGLLGTASYMSPEQVRGRLVDRRTDLWAFGCVLYEMLCGRRAFDGETLSDTLAAVLKSEPDWSRLPADTPERVRALMRRCLERDVDRRQRDAGDARVDLDSPEPAPQRAARPRARGRAILLGAFGAGCVLAGLGAMALWPRDRSSTAPDRVVRFTLSLPPEAAVANVGGPLAVAPDGAALVYAAGREDRRRLIRRSLDSTESAELPGTEGGSSPFFSPDGRWIGFMFGDQIRRVPARGGGVEILLPSGAVNMGCAWADDGSIVFIDGSNRPRVLAPGGGDHRPLIRSEADAQTYVYPDVVAGHDAVVLTLYRQSELFDGRIEAVRISTGERRVVFDQACCPRFVPARRGAPGGDQDRLLFWHAGLLLAAPFDPRTLRVTGSTVPVTRLVERVEVTPMPRFAVSRTGGVLASLPGNIMSDVGRLAWYDPAGGRSVITRAAAVDTPRLSPDGTRIAFINDGAGRGDLWVHEIGRGTVRLTGSRNIQHPLWTPDGERVAFCFDEAPGRNSIRWMRADEAAEPETIWPGREGAGAYCGSFTPDGRTLLVTFGTMEPPTQDLRAVDVGTGEIRSLGLPPPTAGSIRIWPRLSYDGTVLAYTSSETGRYEVYVHRYPDLAGKTLVSAAGGYRPTWSPDSRRLYYQYIDTIHAVDIESTEPLRVSAPRVILSHAPDVRFDVGRDGRILIPHPTGDWGIQDRIDVTVGWDLLARPGS